MIRPLSKKNKKHLDNGAFYCSNSQIMKTSKLHEIEQALEILNRDADLDIEHQIIDALTGILWDEEEAVEIKEFMEIYEITK